MGFGWAAGDFDCLHEFELYPWAKNIVDLWLKNRRKGTKKQDARPQLLAKHEGRVNNAWWSIRRTKEPRAETFTNEILGVGDKGIQRCYGYPRKCFCFCFCLFSFALHSCFLTAVTYCGMLPHTPLPQRHKLSLTDPETSSCESDTMAQWASHVTSL